MRTYFYFPPPLSFRQVVLPGGAVGVRAFASPPSTGNRRDGNRELFGRALRHLYEKRKTRREGKLIAKAKRQN